MEDPQRDLPPERRAAYYVGMLISGVGFLLFLSTFLTGPSVRDSFGQFEQGMHDTAARAIGGMVLIAAGAAISNVGRQGVAGSGLTLDPRQARKDMEPWNRAAGGMLNDTLEEVTALRPPPPLAQIKVRCPKCHVLNDETDRFCGQCGSPL